MYAIAAETNTLRLLLNTSTACDFCRQCILPVVPEPLGYLVLY